MIKESIFLFHTVIDKPVLHSSRQIEGRVTRLSPAEMSLIHVLSRPDIIGSCVLMYCPLPLHVIRTVIRYSQAAHHSWLLQSACLGEKERECVLLVVLINPCTLICLYPPETSLCCGLTHSHNSLINIKICGAHL